ncbi:hypothetical protein DVH24_006009 [Malus domestica]|uniref:Uncharacterized protein n=1 Tax=Malus domestica TaxID=3750 RepID=A0A498IK76_MALDO|nr:hypothetical protein DVH24_006009 [Malus domestica]
MLALGVLAEGEGLHQESIQGGESIRLFHGKVQGNACIRCACRGRRLASGKHPRWRKHSALPWESEEEYLSGNVGMCLPNLVNFSVSLFLVFYSVQLSIQQGNAPETKRRHHIPVTRTTKIQLATTKKRKPVGNPTSNIVKNSKQQDSGGVNTKPELYVPLDKAVKSEERNSYRQISQLKLQFEFQNNGING